MMAALLAAGGLIGESIENVGNSWSLVYSPHFSDTEHPTPNAHATRQTTKRAHRDPRDQRRRKSEDRERDVQGQRAAEGIIAQKRIEGNASK